MSEKLTLSDWFKESNVCFWHASVRITLDGVNKFMHEAFGAETGLNNFEASIERHFGLYPSQITAHGDIDRRPPDLTLPTIEETEVNDYQARKTKELSKEMLYPVAPDPDVDQSNRDADYLSRIVECFPALAGRKIYGFLITKRVSAGIGQTGFSVAAFYVSGNDQNSRIIGRAIEQLSMELLRLASSKSKELAITVKQKVHRAQAFQRLQEPLVSLERAVSDITKFYSAMESALIGPGAFLWHDQCENRSLISSIYEINGANTNPVRAREWLTRIDRRLGLVHNNDALNLLSTDAQKIHHRLVILLFAGLNENTVIKLKDDLTLEDAAFLAKHKDLGSKAFIKHFLQCPECSSPQTSIELLKASCLNKCQFDSVSDFTNWIGLQLLAAGFDVCPTNLENANNVEVVGEMKQFLQEIVNKDRSLKVESISLFLANSVLHNIGSGYQYKKLVFLEGKKFGYEFNIASDRIHFELEPLQIDLMSDDRFQQEFFTGTKFKPDVSPAEGVSKTVTWSLSE